MSFNRFFLVLQFVVLLVPMGILYLAAISVFTAVQLEDGGILPILVSVLLLAPFLVAAFRVMISAIKGTESLKGLGSAWWVVSGMAIGASVVSILVFLLDGFDQLGEVVGTLTATMFASSVLIIPFIHCVYLKLHGDGV